MSRRKPEGLSRRRPDGNVNEWPGHDAVAFQRLVQAAEARIDELGEYDGHAVQNAGAEMGLAPDHWLVREVLAGVYGRFEMWRGRLIADTPEAFLKNATWDDFERHGPDGVAWARELARTRRSG